MAVKRPRSTGGLSTHTETTISNLCGSHSILAPNEYSSAAIGIHSCLVHCPEAEHLGRCFYQVVTAALKTKDCLQRLEVLEKGLKTDCQLDIERAAMIVRLRHYLNNEKSFEEILMKIKEHLNESMREYPRSSIAQSFNEFAQLCVERNQTAIIRDIAGRMQRFQFYDSNEIGQPMNLINLQDRTQADFHWLLMNMEPESPIRAQCEEELKKLLDNSFFIIQHPSPPVATLTAPKNDSVTAKIFCRLLCLLGKSRPEITIENITPVVWCLSKSNPMKGNDEFYQKLPMNWTTYTLVDTSKRQRQFFCAEMSEITLNKLLTIPQGQPLGTGKTHYAPFVYHIDFHITVTVKVPHWKEPIEHKIIVRSAPFGLVTNTAQGKSLFARVFLEDLKNWKSISTSQSTSISNMVFSEATTTNLTLADIVDGIRRHFIHTTGIHPKHWVMLYINKQLETVYSENQNCIGDRFYNVLSKFFAQIDYMAEHALLIFFHNDGLFLGICDSKQISEILVKIKEENKQSVCAIRFGSIDRMITAKDIGIRIDLVHKSLTDPQRYTFDAEKMSLSLGIFIVKIALCKASSFECILSGIIEDTEQSEQKQLSTEMDVFVERYHSEKLNELCPHEAEYTSIWISYDRKERKASDDSNSSTTSALSQTSLMTSTTEANQNNDPYYSWNSNAYATLQPQYPQQIMYPQIPQPTQYSQVQCYSHTSTPYQVQAPNAGMTQLAMTNSYTSQSHEHYINPVPIVIVLSSTTLLTLSDQNVADIISNTLPQYSPFIHSNHILRFNVDSPLPQLFDIPIQFSQNSLPNSQSTFSLSEGDTYDEAGILDLINLDFLDNGN